MRTAALNAAVEKLIIDDGSNDKPVEAARAIGVDHVVRRLRQFRPC